MNHPESSPKPHILFVRVPEIEIAGDGNDLRSSGVAGLSVPLGVATLATVVARHGVYEAGILDLYADFFEFLSSDAANDVPAVVEALSEAIVAKAAEGRFGVIGFSALFAFQHPLVKLVAAQVRKALPDIRLYLGGYVTVAPEYVMREVPEIDVAFLGEGDIAVCKVLEAEAAGQPMHDIPSIALREGGAVRCNKTLTPPQDLDALGSPTFELINLELYRKLVGRLELPILTSRSCPFACNFCSSRLYSGRKFRKRSVEQILSEIEHDIRVHKMDFLWIRDDNFLADKKHTKALLSGVIERKLKFGWCESNGFHVNSLDEEVLDLCKASGCTEAIFAVESGSPRVLREIMNKDVNLEHALRMADYCHKIGLPLQAYFVVGNPGETEEEIRQTADFAVKMRVEHCTFSIATPFPGTKYYELAVQRGYLTHSEDHILSMQYMTANLETEFLTAQRVKELQYDANIRVNFLENKRLAGDGKQLEQALEWFSAVASQYSFHAVAGLLKGYLHGRLGQQAEAAAAFAHVEQMLATQRICDAYGKYFDWDTPATNAYRQWRMAGGRGRDAGAAAPKAGG